MARLDGKAALVTGGSRGIGAAIARRLAEEGASVAVTYVNGEAAAQAVVREIEARGGRAAALRADASDAEAVTAAVDRTAEAFGRLDILVNNAGTFIPGPIDAATIADFDATFAINVRAVFAASVAAARHMTEGGRIIQIGSVNADRMPFAGGAVYGASKAAVQMLSKGFARDLGPRGITVNVVQPGPVATDMNKEDGDFADMLRGLMAIPRYAQGSDVAALVAFLAGPESGMITGAALNVDGGFGT